LRNSSIRAHQEYCRDIDPLNLSGPASLLVDRKTHLLPGLRRISQNGRGDGIGCAGDDAAGTRVAVAERYGGDERGRKVRRSARKSQEWIFVTVFVTLWRRSTPRIVGKEVR
jgi:hypothetical protein